MPTKKPRLQIVVDFEVYTKYKQICQTENRSESNMGELIIKQYIKEYEQIHGEIQLKKD